MDSLDYLLDQGRIVAGARWPNRKQVLLELSGIAAKAIGLDHKLLFERALERERLGSTGVGEGVAIPHVRTSAVSAPVGVFARLAEPVDFDAIDDRPCDLVFLLVTPESAGADHLRALSRVARVFRQDSVRTALRDAHSAEAIAEILCPATESDAA